MFKVEMIITGCFPFLVRRPWTGKKCIHCPFPLIVDLGLRETLPLGLNWMRWLTLWKHCIAEVAKNNTSLLSISVHSSPMRQMKAGSACFQVLQHLKITFGYCTQTYKEHVLSICCKALRKECVVSDCRKSKGILAFAVTFKQKLLDLHAAVRLESILTVDLGFKWFNMFAYILLYCVCARESWIFRHDELLKLQNLTNVFANSNSSELLAPQKQSGYRVFASRNGLALDVSESRFRNASLSSTGAESLNGPVFSSQDFGDVTDCMKAVSWGACLVRVDLFDAAVHHAHGSLGGGCGGISTCDP